MLSPLGVPQGTMTFTELIVINVMPFLAQAGGRSTSLDECLSAMGASNVSSWFFQGHGPFRGNTLQEDFCQGGYTQRERYNSLRPQDTDATSLLTLGHSEGLEKRS